MWVPAHLCPFPIPTWLDLPVCHREPDVPPYHLWGSMWEIWKERGQDGQVEEGLWGQSMPVTFFFRDHRLDGQET